MNCTLESEKPEGCKVGRERRGQTHDRFMNIIIARFTLGGCVLLHGEPHWQHTVTFWIFLASVDSICATNKVLCFTNNW